MNLEKCLVDNPPHGWDAIVERGIKEWKGRELKAVPCKLVLSASIYKYGGREII